jgi:hypothetical protein
MGSSLQQEEGSDYYCNYYQPLDSLADCWLGKLLLTFTSTVILGFGPCRTHDHIFTHCLGLACFLIYPPPPHHRRMLGLQMPTTIYQLLCPFVAWIQGQYAIPQKWHPAIFLLSQPYEAHGL